MTPPLRALGPIAVNLRIEYQIKDTQSSKGA